MESLIQQMKEMRRDKKQFLAIVEHFLNRGLDKKLVAESFVTAFGFEFNPQMRGAILAWERCKERFNRFAERHAVRRQFGDMPKLEQVIQFYGVSEGEIRAELKLRGLENEIKPISWWSSDEGVWQGYTVDFQGLIELDKSFPAPSGARLSYWEW